MLEKHEARGFKGRSKGGVKDRWRKTLRAVYEELVKKEKGRDGAGGEESESD